MRTATRHTESRPTDDRRADDTASAAWPMWSTTVQVVVTDRAALTEARQLVAARLAEVDAAASRFRDDSELSLLATAGGRPRRISPLLADLVAAALSAAETSDGDVDPALGGPLARLGYDRDIHRLTRDHPAAPPPAARAAGTGFAPRAQARAAGARGCGYRGATNAVAWAAPAWRRIVLDGDLLTVPAGVRLDLGATAKAHTADRCAALVAGRLGTGVLVSLGGDLATAGAAPPDGWRVLVQDRPGEPACTITLAAGGALATSSTIGRRWRHDGRVLHHILDPRTCQPAPVVWRTATVAASSCLTANTASTAALVRGGPAASWLRRLGLPARLVEARGGVLTVAGWPAEPASTAARSSAAAGSERVGVDRAVDAAARAALTEQRR